MGNSTLKHITLYGIALPLLFLGISLGIWGKGSFVTGIAWGLFCAMTGVLMILFSVVKKQRAPGAAFVVAYLREAFIRLFILCSLLIFILLFAKANAFGVICGLGSGAVLCSGIALTMVYKYTLGK